MPTDVGSVGIQLRTERACDYIITPMPSNHLGWHARWFYLKNDNRHPFSAYTGRVIGEAPQCWKSV